MPGRAPAGVVGRYGEGWKVRVTAPAEDGRANDGVVALLAALLDLPRGNVAIARGRHAQDKVVTVTGIDPLQIDRRLARASGRAA